MPDPKALPRSWLNRIEKTAKTVKEGDLYRALHHVGSDSDKFDIERALRGILDTATFDRVVAVFKIATTD